MKIVHRFLKNIRYLLSFMLICIIVDLISHGNYLQRIPGNIITATFVVLALSFIFTLLDIAVDSVLKRK